MFLMHLGLCLILVLLCFHLINHNVQGFSVISEKTCIGTHCMRNRCMVRPMTASNHATMINDTQEEVNLECIGLAGISEDEIPIIFEAIREAASESDVSFATSEDRLECVTISHDIVPGALGRVVLLSLNHAMDWDDDDDDDERLASIQSIVATKIDSLIGNQIEQPVLISIEPNAEGYEDESLISKLTSIVQETINEYDLREPIEGGEVAEDTSVHEMVTAIVEIDKGLVLDVYTRKEYFDTSNIMIFDNFIDNNLRERLLDVILKRDGSWDDKSKGPDPRIFSRGALNDTPDQEHEEATCWGMKEEYIVDLCYNNHDAIKEVEQKLSVLFPDFIVSRMPEAVYGNVSPLTVNAPTFGDAFSVHIDADPNTTPASPWTDVFGRYYNRNAGKPRFVSCLLYLNDEWHQDWGATTKFFDPPTGETFEVTPKPGRCIIMDQDIQHSVVSPTSLAGEQPRYSIVWKLILHPKRWMQSMQISNSDVAITYIGSANQ
jgi:hypothetical protein